MRGRAALEITGAVCRQSVTTDWCQHRGHGGCAAQTLQDSCPSQGRDRKRAQNTTLRLFFFFFPFSSMEINICAWRSQRSAALKVDKMPQLLLVGFKSQWQPSLLCSLLWHAKAPGHQGLTPCPHDSRAELPLTSPGTSATDRRAIDGPKCSKCLPAFD